MQHQIATLVPIALLLALACDPAPAPCSSDEASSTGSTDTTTDTGTETEALADGYCCNCPSGECQAEPDEAACNALAAATGEAHTWCDGSAQDCLAECRTTTICCQCEPTPPTCMWWPFGEAQCFASAGADALWCEDANPESCAGQCGG